jgi:glycine betaine/choline ABC-type transport system substrate-binding protein
MLLSEKRLKYNNNTIHYQNSKRKLLIANKLYTENMILLEILSVALRETDCHPTSETLE